MQSIGERLIAAREKKGISLRDAAEMTKIRSDFLASMEEDDFDFELPEIYKRGFVKNYARFLKLDPEVLITDYNTQRLSATRLAKRSAGADFFGQIDLQTRKNKAAQTAVVSPQLAPATESAEPAEHSHRPDQPVARVDDLSDEDEDEGRSRMSTDDKILYAKVGVSFVGALVAVLLLVWLFGLIFSGSGREDPDQAAQDRDTPSAVDGSATSPRDPAAPAGTRRETVLLVATGDVTVQVRETASNEVRFRGSLTAGQEQTVEVRPPMLVQFTNGENLQIEFRGERVAPSRAGAASIRLPAPE